MLKIPPRRVRALGTAGRNRLFGEFEYARAPVPGNPEKVKVLDDWKKNLATFDLPQELAVLPGADQATFHVLVQPRFLALVDAWRTAGVLGDVLTWNGSYASRLVRGTTLGTLSSHAWGSAFDINVPFNPLGKPATTGEGTVLRLLEAAQDLGWCWGGYFTRSDPMHFELARL